MTKPQGRPEGAACLVCRHFEEIEIDEPGHDAYLSPSIGVCNCDDGDHWGHVVAMWHWCECFAEKAVGDD